MLRLTAVTAALLAAVITATPSALAAPGDLDPAFPVRVLAGTGTQALVARGADGRLVTARATRFPESKTALRSFSAMGTPDAGFGGGGTATLPAGHVATGLRVQDDGSIVVATETNGSEFALVRVSSSGGMVTVQGTPTKYGPLIGPAGGSSAVVAPDGSAFFPYVRMTGNQSSRLGVLRLRSNGTLDPAFAGAGTAEETADGAQVFRPAVVRSPIGTVTVIGSAGARAVRFTTEGKIDPSFTSANSPGTNFGAIAVRDTAGRVLLASRGGSPGTWDLRRIALTGGEDPDFPRSGAVTVGGGQLATPYGITLDAQGRILIVGGVHQGGNPESGADAASQVTVVRLSADGRLDRTFGGGDGVATTQTGAVARGVVAAGDRIVVAGGKGASDGLLLALQGAGAGAAPAAPDTTITDGPPASTSSDFVTFSFSSDTPGVTFECRLAGDEQGWLPCTSPAGAENPPPGQNTFLVRAIGADGTLDATPASRAFTTTTDAGTPPPATDTPPAGGGGAPPAGGPPAGGGGVPNGPDTLPPAIATVRLTKLVFDKQRRFGRASVSVSGPGRLVLRLKGKLPRSRKVVTLASGRATAAKAGAITVKLTTTAAVRRAVRARAVKGVLSATFTPTGRPFVRTNRKATIKRR